MAWSTTHGATPTGTSAPGQRRGHLRDPSVFGHYFPLSCPAFIRACVGRSLGDLVVVMRLLVRGLVGKSLVVPRRRTLSQIKGSAQSGGSCGAPGEQWL